MNFLRRLWPGKARRSYLSPEVASALRHTYTTIDETREAIKAIARDDETRAARKSQN